MVLLWINSAPLRNPATIAESLTRASIQQGHVVTLEITSGQVYRGKLLEGADYPISLLLDTAHFPASATYHTHAYTLPR